MEIYMVVQNVRLFNGKKHYKINQTFKSNTVSAENLKRWKEKGFVRLIDRSYEEAAEEDANDQEDKTGKENAETLGEGTDGNDDSPVFLSEEEINQMNKTTLKKYAKEIGISDFDNGIATEDLKTLVIGYIKASEVADEEEAENE